MKNLYEIRYTKYKILFFVLFNFSFLIFNLPKANAQGVSLGLWPPILQLMIQPGKSLTQVYKLNNFGDPVIVSSHITAFVAEGEEGQVSLVDCHKLEVVGCESLGWFSFQNADLELGQAFFLGSGRTQEIVLKIGVPDFAAEGDYYNSLIFTTQVPQIESGRVSQATAAIASNILITVSKDGNPTRDINIIDFSAKNKFSILNFQFSIPIFDSFEPIPAALRVENTGNAYTPVSGKITLSGFPGLKSDFEIIKQNVLAGSSRLLLATPSAQLLTSPNTKYEIRNTLLLPKAFYLGRYNLEVRVENADGLVKIAKTSFFALPFKIILGIILLIPLLYKGSTLVRRVKAT